MKHRGGNKPAESVPEKRLGWWPTFKGHLFVFFRNCSVDSVGRKKAIRNWVIMIIILALLLSPLAIWAASNSK